MGNIFHEIERGWRHLIDDLGFIGDVLDSLTTTFYIQSKIFREYETYYKVSTTPLCDDWEVSNLLNGAVIASKESNNLVESLKDSSLNGAYSKFNHIAKKICTNPKYYNVLSKPIGTDFNTKLSNKTIRGFLGLKEEVEGYVISTFNALYHSYNYLIDNYSFELEPSVLYDKYNSYKYMGTIVKDDITHYVTSIGLENNQVVVRTIYILKVANVNTIVGDNIYLPIYWEDGEFLYVSVNNRIEYILIDGNEKLITFLKDKEDYQYPTLVCKLLGVNTANPEYREGSDVYGITSKLMKRSGLDWEDIYKQLSGDLSDIDKPTDKDYSYANDMKNITNIMVTLACSVNANNPLIIEYMYRLFKQCSVNSDSLFGSNAGKVFYKHLGYGHEIRWNNITYTKENGKVCRPKQYVSESKKEEILESYTHTDINGNTTTGIKRTTTKVLHLYHQVSNDTYYKVSVYNPVHVTNALGKEIKTDLPIFSNMKPRTKKDIEAILDGRKSLDEDGDTDSTEFIIPLFPAIVRLMGAYKGSSLITISLRGVWQAKKRVKKKWYATTGFAVTRIIVSIVIIIVTWGSGTPFVIVANAAANIALNILIQILISLSIKLAIKYVCKVFRIEGLGLIVANLVSTICETAIGNSIGYSNSMIALSSGLSDMIVSGSMSLDNFANALSNTAFMGLAGKMPILATVYKLVQDPQYLQAINNKQWSQVLITTASTYATAMAINAMGEAKEAEPQYETLKYGIKDTTPTLGESFRQQLDSVSLSSIVEMPIAYNMMENQVTLDKIQQNLSELQAKLDSQNKLKNALENRSNLLNSILLNQSLIGV